MAVMGRLTWTNATAVAKDDLSWVELWWALLGKEAVWIKNHWVGINRWVVSDTPVETLGSAAPYTDSHSYQMLATTVAPFGMRYPRYSSS